jgi:hypothetical protein
MSEASFTEEEGGGDDGGGEEEEASEERWVLHELWHRGKRLLHDPRTNLLYRRDGTEGWPLRVGYLTDNGSVVMDGDRSGSAGGGAGGAAGLGQGVTELAKVYNVALKYMEVTPTRLVHH